jgi:vacuolar-type H+-ATPase subunit F/Vma7
MNRAERRRRLRGLRGARSKRVTRETISRALQSSDVGLVMLSLGMVHELPELPERFELDENLPGLLAVALTKGEPGELRAYALDAAGRAMAEAMVGAADLLL